jgi:hypothetical protein
VAYLTPRPFRRREVLVGKFRHIVLLGWLLFTIACASARPAAPPGLEPTPPSPEAPSREVRDLIVMVLDAASRPIVGASVVVHYTEDAEHGIPCERVSDGNGFTHCAINAPSVRVSVQKTGYEDALVDLPDGTHNVHLTRAVVPVGSGVGQAPWKGRLKLAPNNRGFIDEDGQWVLPLCAHFGEAFSAYVRRPADVEAQLIAIKQAGYDCIRFWDTLGYYQGAWRDKEVMPWSFTNDGWPDRNPRQIPATPNYYWQLREFLLALKRIGLTAHHTRGDLNGQATSRVVDHAERVAQLYDEIGWDVLALWEANNEDFQNGSFGPEGLRRIAEPAKRRGAITASSCPGACSEELHDLKAFTQGFSIFYVHGYRSGESTDRLRHIFSLGYEAHEWTDVRLGWQGEPTGPNDRPGLGVTVNYVNDVEELALLAAQSLMTRQAWVYMSQCGVFWHCRIDEHPGFFAVPRMRAKLATFAPDVMTWRLTHRGRGDAAWCGPDGCRGDSSHARIDQAISPDGRKVVATVHGGIREVKNFMGCTAKVQLLAAQADESIDVADDITVPAGAVFELPRYRVGRLLFAECQ